jgi:hypothetical protein
MVLPEKKTPKHVGSQAVGAGQHAQLHGHWPCLAGADAATETSVSRKCGTNGTNGLPLE